MVVARRLKQRRQSEFALIRRATCRAVLRQFNSPATRQEVALGCSACRITRRGPRRPQPRRTRSIHFTRMGLGAALGRQPTRVRRIVEAMRQAVTVPVTVRSDSPERRPSELSGPWLARSSTAAPIAITVHGRTREARYRTEADWSAIAEVAAAVPVPVVGNGDLLFPHEAAEHMWRPLAARR